LRLGISGSRYYDPDTARFTTQDTYLGEQGTPPSLHRYLYAYSNPTVYIDLEGYAAWELRAPPEKAFFDKWILDREHARDIYRGIVNGSPVGNYRPESARVDATMDLIRTGLEFKAGGEALGAVTDKLKQPAKNLLGKIIEKTPGAVKDAFKTAAKVTTELKDGAQEIGQELFYKSKTVFNSSKLANNRGEIVLKHGAEEAEQVGSDVIENVVEEAVPKVLIVPKEKADVFSDWEKAASEGRLIRTDPKTVRGSGFRKKLAEEQGPPPTDAKYDADHKIELCVGGQDCAKTNGQWLEQRPNRTSGPKVYNQVKDDPIGTKYEQVILEGP
jgi:hypothetical protein